MWLGWRGSEVRRGKAWDGSLMRTGGKMAVNGVREERKDGTPAQMTPKEIKKKRGGTRQPNFLSFTHGLSVLYVL